MTLVKELLWEIIFVNRMSSFYMLGWLHSLLFFFYGGKNFFKKEYFKNSCLTKLKCLLAKSLDYLLIS